MKKWMKAGFVAVATLLAACGANTTKTQETTVSVSEAQANWDKIVESGVIKVSTAGTLYPQSFHNDKNELTGYDVEIMKEVAKRLNLKVEFTEMGVDGMLTALDSGMTDIANYSIEEGAKNFDAYLHTTPHKYSFTSMVVRGSDNSGIHSWEDVKGKKAALFFGSEGYGLDNKTIAACDVTTIIPMSHQVDSLNVAASSAVAFWELFAR